MRELIDLFMKLLECFRNNKVLGEKDRILVASFNGFAFSQIKLMF